MPELVGQDGQVVDLGHEDALAALQSGQAGLRADKPVNFVAPDGSVVNADAQHAEQLIATGYRFAGSQEVQADLDRQKYGESIGQQVGALLEGAASGASLGIYDMGARALAPSYADELVKRRDANPITAGIGEAGGAIGMALWTGGASLEALGAKAAQKAATRVATTAIGQAATAGALEAALFGATKAVSDDYLRNHEITAERVALGAGLGALTGGLFGAGAAAVSMAAQKLSAGFLGKARMGMAAGLTDDAAAAERILTGQADDLADGLGAAAAATGGGGKIGWKVPKGAWDDIVQRNEADDRFVSTLEAIPIDAIDLPPPRDAGRTASVVEGLGKGAEMPPIRVAETADGRWVIEDGIHRTNAAKADGATHVPALVERFAGEAPKSPSVGLADFMRPAPAPTAVAAPASGGLLQDAAQKVQDFAANSRASRQVDTVIESAAKDSAEAVSRMARTSDALGDYLTQGPKRPEILKRFAEDPPDFEAMTNGMVDAAEKLKAGLDDIKANSHMYNKTYQLFAGNVSKNLDDTLARVGPARDAESAADLFRAIDGLKTTVGREAKKLVRAEPNAGELADQLYEHLRAPLQDAAVVGKSAAAFQAENNAAMTAMFRYSRAFDSTFAASYAQRVEESARSAFRDGVAVADPAKVAAFMRQAGDFTSSLSEDILLTGSKRQAEAFRTLAKNYGFDGNAAERVAQMSKDADLIAERVAGVRTTREAAKAYDQAVAAMRELPGGGALASFATTAGKVANLLAPDAGVAAAASKAAIAERVHQAAVRAADRGERAVESAGIALARARKLQRIERGTADAATVLGYEFSLSGRNQISGLREHLDSVADPQSNERLAMRRKLSTLRQVSPPMADAMEGQALRTAQWLRGKAGPSVLERNPGDPFAHLRKTGNTAEQSLKLLRYIDAATTPQRAVERIRDGKHSPEDVETLRELYPRMFGRLQQSILTELARAKEVPPEDVQRALAKITGVPVDGMTPQKSAALQQLIAQAPAAQALAADRAGPSPKRTGKAPKLAGLYDSETLAERADRK